VPATAKDMGAIPLRHVFETIGGESRDRAAVDHIMGHVRKDMAAPLWTGTPQARSHTCRQRVQCRQSCRTAVSWRLAARSGAVLVRDFVLVDHIAVCRVTSSRTRWWA
jgi:hypothetical protein